MLLSSSEIASIREVYDRDHEVFHRFSDYVLSECRIFQREHPGAVRVVFAREPPIKTFDSICNKIEARRKATPTYAYDNVEDIVALTIICPYRTDTREVIAWMRQTFHQVLPKTDAEALRDHPDGHRGYHFIISVGGRAHREFRRLKCEIQVKTILEEAFDAKSHDLTYKPIAGKIDHDLKGQFALLSALLRAIDDQSEFLKRLILKQREELALRRAIVHQVYARQPDVIKAGHERGIDLETMSSGDIDNILVLARGIPSQELTAALCKVFASCAFRLGDVFLQDEAIEVVDRYVDANPQDGWRVYLRGTIKWYLGRHEGGIEDIASGLRRALEVGDQDLIVRAMNNFVYFVSDWKCLLGGERPAWTMAASEYVEKLEALEKDFHIEDTLGIFPVAFGTTIEEIERGRGRFRAARQKGEGDPSCEAYYRLHEFIALRRMLELLENQQGSGLSQCKVP
jgi:ppGpp synthetase/RelA/SpoT-type nucleotidyltranferase